MVAIIEQGSTDNLPNIVDVATCVITPFRKTSQHLKVTAGSQEHGSAVAYIGSWVGVILRTSNPASTVDGIAEKV